MTPQKLSFLVSLLLALASLLPLRADKPNVLFIATDDMNCDLSAYGHPLVHSPQIDRLASRGILFERAYSQNPVCNPSRSSFLTGLYPEQTQSLPTQATFGNIFRRFSLPSTFETTATLWLV